MVRLRWGGLGVALAAASVGCGGSPGTRMGAAADGGALLDASRDAASDGGVADVGAGGKGDAVSHSSTDQRADAGSDAGTGPKGDAVADAASEAGSETRTPSDGGACTGAGCVCAPVAVGHPGATTIASGISKLIADPNGCLVYGLLPGSPSSLLVMDAASKTELSRVPLRSTADDFDVSPDGRWIVAALDGHHALSIVDKSTWTAKTVLVAFDPERVQVSNAGIAYYVTLDQWASVSQIDLTQTSPVDRMLTGSIGYEPDIQLSADGTRLFTGESGTTGGELVVYDVGASGLTFGQRSTWDGGSGFYNTTRWLYLDPLERDVFFAGHQLDAKNLEFNRGVTGQVFAADRAGTFAISAAGPIDSKLLRPLAPFPTPAAAATLAAADRELWWYEPATKTLHWENVAERIGTRTLGVREQPARAIGEYRFTRLVADPVRKLLYGLDPGAAVVVLIDRSTLDAIAEVVVGSSPTDIDVDPTGAYLYVSHAETQAVAQIRLDTFSFAKFFLTYRDGAEIATAGPQKVVTIDEDQFVSTSIIDVGTGARNDFGAGGFMAAIAATADGRTFFTGESMIAGVTRYDLSTGQFVVQASSNYEFTNPKRSLVITPDGSGVYYGGYFLDGATLRVRRYAMPDTIETVTSDGRLAVSATNVYRVSDGAMLGTLSPGGEVQAASPDGHTLFVATDSGIATVDLTTF